MNDLDFSIRIDGSHTEGPEARTRFEKLTKDYITALKGAGFDPDVAKYTFGAKPVDLLLPDSVDPDPASWQAAIANIKKDATEAIAAATKPAPEGPTDAELEELHDPKLALNPDEMTVADIKKALAENDYTVAELDAAIAAEGRESAMKALNDARDARLEVVTP